MSWSGTKEIILEEGEHYRFEGHNVTFPGMQVPITVIPDAGYALTSILVDGQEQINKAVFNEDGSVNIPEALRPYMGGKDKIIPTV